MKLKPTNRIDHEDPRCNMFGLLPCPKCGAKHRWPTQAIHKTHPSSIVCDDCGFVEPMAKEDMPEDL